MSAIRRRGRSLAALITLLLALSAATAASATTASAASLTAGGDFSCAVLAEGAVTCWGAAGRLGTGGPGGSRTPVPVGALSGAVAAGGAHACALRADRLVYCWGAQDAGQLGPNSGADALSPVQAGTLGDVVALTAGDRHTCALRRDGTVRCWGSAARTGGGDGDGITRVVALDAGATATCAVRSRGTVRCWGALAPPPPLTDATAVAVGDGHACALRRGGTVVCWGADDHGQRGGSDGVGDVPGLGGVVAIAAGGDESCALRGDGTVACWGAGGRGQIGDSALADRAVPTTVPGVAGATEIAVGGAHACAAKADATAVCWGDNADGQVGSGLDNVAVTPVTAVGTTGATAVSSSFGGHRCAVVATTVKCWGVGEQGQLGNGASVPQLWLPTAVPGLPPATGVAAGGDHTCAILADSSVRCWGQGDKGELGDGGLTMRLTPVTATGVSARAIAAGYHSTCAVTTAARVSCWGDRFFRAAPDQQYGHWEQQPVPTTVDGTDGAVAVAVVDFATCALFADGGVKCWGSNNDGELGIGHRGDAWHSTEPLAVLVADGQPLTGVAELVAVGGRTTCARRLDGQVFCWGGDRGDYASAVAGGDYPLPRDRCWLGEGAVRCLGDASHGMLGEGAVPPPDRWTQPFATPVVWLDALRAPFAPVLDLGPEPDDGAAPPLGCGTPPPGAGGGTVPSPPSGGGAPRAPAKRFAIVAAKPGRGGRIALTLSLPADGSVRVVATAKLRGRPVAWFATKKPLVLKAGRRAIAVVPSKTAGRAFKRVRGAKVRLRVTFTPKRGRAVVKTVTVTISAKASGAPGRRR